MLTQWPRQHFHFRSQARNMVVTSSPFSAYSFTTTAPFPNEPGNKTRIPARNPGVQHCSLTQIIKPCHILPPLIEILSIFLLPLSIPLPTNEPCTRQQDYKVQCQLGIQARNIMGVFPAATRFSIVPVKHNFSMNTDS